MAGKLRPLDLVLRGVNRVRGPIREVNAQIESMMKPVRRVQGALRSLSREARLPQLAAAARDVGSELMALGHTALYGAAGVAAIGVAMKKFIDHADDVGAVASKLGITTDALQELRFAAEQLDVEQGALDSSLEMFNKNVVDVARGTGRAVFAFRALGLTSQKVKQLGDSGAVFEEFTKRLEGIKSPAVRARLALAAFGNVDMVNVVGAGPAKLRELREEAHALGAVMDAETVRAAGDADNELRRLGASAKGLGYEVGAALLPTVVEVSEATRAWIRENRGLIKETIVPAVRNIAAALRVVVPLMAKFASTTAGMSVIAGALAVKTFGPLVLSLGKFSKAAFDVGVRVMPTIISAVRFLSSGIVSLATRAFPILLTGMRTLAALALANPLLLVVAAVAALIAGGVLLYKNYKPFADLVDGIWVTISKVAAKASWLDFGFGAGPQAETAAEAAAASPYGSSARAYAPGTSSWQGRVGIDVGVARGATASVTGLQSSTRQVALETGMVMSPAY